MANPNPITNGGSNHTTKGSKTSTSAANEGKEHPVVLKIRAQCLARGSKGIKGLGRCFKRNDDDGNNQIDAEELWELCKQYGIELKKPEVAEAIAAMDEDGSGTLNFDEFLVALRPPMSGARVRLIDQAFAKLDKTGDGVVTVEDLKGVYSVQSHPKFVNGEWTEDQCLGQFLKTFDVGDADGKVEREEFIDYYRKVSASIDDDSCFDLMMRRAWKL